MDRIEINCEGIKSAQQVIESAGFKVLMSPNFPSEIQIDAKAIDPAKIQSLLDTLGKSSYQELDSGQRAIKSVSITPVMMMNRTKFTVIKHKSKIAIGAAAAIAAAAGYFA